MKDRFYESEGSKCGQCGSDLGIQKIWTLVYSDDPPALVERVHNGTINWVRCNHPNCGFKNGWFWPNTFLFIDIHESRVVCVTQATAAAQQFALLREALESNSIRERNLDPEVLQQRTKFVGDYRHVEKALNVELKYLEMENASILKYLERKDLRGRARIDALIKSAIETGGAISIEADETTSEFLSELEEFQSTLTGNEDQYVPVILEQIIDLLLEKLKQNTLALHFRDESSALADVLRAARDSADHVLAKSKFEDNLAEAEAETLRLRLTRLCELQSSKMLNKSAVAPIDTRPELLELVDKVMAGEDSQSATLAQIDTSVLPEVKGFLELLSVSPEPRGLSEFQSDIEEPPAPSWIILASQASREMLVALAHGAVPQSVLEPIADIPLARACVEGDYASYLIVQNILSLAMVHLTRSLEILDGAIQGLDLSSNYWIAKAYAVCLQRMGVLQSRFGKFEESIKALHTARSIFEKIGAQEGLLFCLNEEATIRRDLGQLQNAEELFTRLVREMEGRGRANEVRYLANLANVYRLLPPYMDVEVKLASKKNENADSKNESEPVVDSVTKYAPETVPDLVFKSKAGIRISCDVEGHEELNFHDMIGSEPIRLLYLGLAIARLNGDASFENLFLGRLADFYDMLGCHALSNLLLDQLFETMPFDKAELDVHRLVLNRIRARADDQEEAGDVEQALATRKEALQILNFMLQTTQAESLSQFVKYEMRCEKATLLEALGRWEEARQEYLATIDDLERSRGWMREPENKKGLQSRRWKPYMRGARTVLRLYEADPTREDLLIEVWQLNQAGRSRALLDSISAERNPMTDCEGITSIRPYSFLEVINSLPCDTAVLEYFLIPTMSGCAGKWAMMVVEPGVSKPWLAWQEPDMELVLKAKECVNDLADEYVKNIVHYGMTTSLQSIEQRYVVALEKLADIIFPAGLADQLRERGYRKLVVAADAYLHEMPFAALRPIQGGRRIYLGLPQEDRGFQVVYAPSSSIFAHWIGMARENKPKERRIALFIDPFGDLSRGNSDVLPTFRSIENHFEERGIVVTRHDGNGVTPKAWINEIQNHNLVVYFGHSVAGHGDPDRAALILNDGSGSVASISAGDVYRESSRRLFLKNSLIVFASCSGGLAFQSGWDSDRELTGLSVAYLQAGCGAVIGASRPLLDAPTLVLLESFLERILSGDDATTSLTEAQREMAESNTPYRHPHFWGYLGLMGVPHWKFESKNEENNWQLECISESQFKRSFDSRTS
ncbi:MAG: CHAT domain-containing protein [Nitrosomonadaceae bacterium]|nr:CHAT domain-containing protein [Nitrosomonadaceae bacterium]